MKSRPPKESDLRGQIEQLTELNRRYIQYIRQKVNQLLEVMGTQPLRPEELDDETLLEFDPIGIVAGAFQQILEHLRETVQELEMARDELQAIFNATGVGISIIDTNFRIIRCNEKQRQMLVSEPSEDIRGRFCYEVYCYKDSPGLDCPAVETMATGKAVTLREVKKKGRFFQVVTTPLRDSEGGIKGVIEVLIDVTEKKKAEELMLRTEKLVSLGQMAAGIAHELNTPLGNILGYARLLEKDPSLSEKQAERVRIIAEQANRCSRIIKGLLDFARKPDDERLNAECNLTEAINSALSLLKKEADKRQIEIILEDGTFPSVRGHAREIEQVFVNIILNALQAIGKQGGVTIKGSVRENSVVVEISDTGPGIPEEIKDRVFDPFFTTKPPGEGTGLGLSISAGTMSRLGGGIEVENLKAGGAVFRLVFPLTGGGER